MFKKLALSAVAALAAIAAMPAAADAEYFGAGVEAQQTPRGNPRVGRPEVRREVPRACRGRDAGTLLGAIAGGLLGRPMAGAPAERGRARAPRDCR